MRPEKNSYTIDIPITFDAHHTKPTVNMGRVVLSVGLFIILIIVSVLILLFMEDNGKLLLVVGLFVVVIGVIRLVIMKELYFKDKHKGLEENNYTYNHTLFWDISEISPKLPYIDRYQNGSKAIYVRLEKDVIVGKEDDNMFNHYEAISEAYLQMQKHGINAIHLDYMDTVGKDVRMSSLYDIGKEAVNEDLKDLLTHIFDNVENTMNKSFSTYDVYAFYSIDKDEIFWSGLQVVLDCFLEANYVRYKVLDRDEIVEPVKAIMNIENFSINNVTEDLFKRHGSSSYLKPIWVEKKGNRKILNKTQEELMEERNVRMAETFVSKKDKKRKKRKYKGQDKIDLFVEEVPSKKEDEDIDLF